jgi:hypothetical protein
LAGAEHVRDHQVAFRGRSAREIARDHKIKPVGTYKFGICEDDLVIAQLTKNILPYVGSAEWTSPLALDQFSLTFGAHLIQTYGGLVRLPELSSRGLAPWQQRRATEFLCEHLNGGILLRCWSSSSRIGLLQTPKWRAVCLRQRAMLEGSL